MESLKGRLNYIEERSVLYTDVSVCVFKRLKYGRYFVSAAKLFSQILTTTG